MNTNETSLGMTVRKSVSFEEALSQVKEALKTEGFGVLTEIDVKATLKQKIDVDFHPYQIIGACNPPLAHRALSADERVGLLLPCNVTVSQLDEGLVEIAIINPLAMMEPVDSPEIAAVALDASERLRRVAASLERD